MICSTLRDAARAALPARAAHCPLSLYDTSSCFFDSSPVTRTFNPKLMKKLDASSGRATDSALFAIRLDARCLSIGWLSGFLHNLWVGWKQAGRPALRISSHTYHNDCRQSISNEFVELSAPDHSVHLQSMTEFICSPSQTRLSFH